MIREQEDLAEIEGIVAAIPDEFAGEPIAVEITARDAAGRIEAVSITPMEESPHA